MVSSSQPLGRRSFVAGIAAGLSTTMLSRDARAQSPRILIVGGSAIAGALGLYLGQRLTELGFTVHRRAKSSTGLARPDFFDWPAEAAQQYAEFRPDATVCMFGGNDGQGLHMGKGAEPEWIRWHESGWTEEYGRRVDAFAKAVSPHGEHLCWLGMPVIRQTKLRGRVERMNEIFRAAMEFREYGHYIETWSSLADANGDYTDHLVIGGKKVRVRANDGVHLTVQGAHHLVEHVAPTIQSTVSAPSHADR